MLFSIRGTFFGDEVMSQKNYQLALLVGMKALDDHSGKLGYKPSIQGQRNIYTSPV